MLQGSALRRVLGESGRILTPHENVGFVTLPDQFVNKLLPRGFNFNVMIIGDTGIGKSTLIENLFKSDFHEVPHDHRNQVVGMEAFTHNIVDGGVKLNLTVISSVGFGDQLNKSKSCDPILKYIDDQYSAYLQEELKATRNLSDYHDSRVHVCLYMIPPTGRKLRALDLLCLKALHEHVNVIPIIARADALTKDDLAGFKSILRADFLANGLNFFDPYIAEDSVRYQDIFPLAVTCSRDTIEVNQEKVAVRQYPWGVAEVENEDHSDFARLREVLLRTNMEPLMRETHVHKYERYRSARLRVLGFHDTDAAGNPVSLRETFEGKRREFLAETSKKEDEMRIAFVTKVKVKEAELKSAEASLNEKYDKLRVIHLNEQQKLKQQSEALDAERKAWLAHHAAAVQLMEENNTKKKDKKDKKKA